MVKYLEELTTTEIANTLANSIANTLGLNIGWHNAPEVKPLVDGYIKIIENSTNVEEKQHSMQELEVELLGIAYILDGSIEDSTLYEDEE